MVSLPIGRERGVGLAVFDTSRGLSPLLHANLPIHLSGRYKQRLAKEQRVKNKNTAGIVGAAQPFRRNGAERRNPGKPLANKSAAKSNPVIRIFYA